MNAAGRGCQWGSGCIDTPRKKGIGGMKRTIVLIVLSLVTMTVVGALGDDDFSELTEFKGKMMESVASQLSSASDMTTTSGNRAILAALLSLEFATQRPDFTIDYTLPIYVCKHGDIASLAVGGDEDYAVIIFQMNPLYTSYGFLHGNEPATVIAALKAANENLWQVPLEEYNEKLAALVSQLS